MKKELKQDIKKNKQDILIIDVEKYGKKNVVANFPEFIKLQKKVKFSNHQDVNFDCFANACNIFEKQKQYEYIYDVICDYLDEQFQKNNHCQFSSNVCISGRNKDSHYYFSGCCHIYPRNNWYCKIIKKILKRQGILTLNLSKSTKCPHLSGKECQIKAISCKLFTCQYLKKQKIDYKIDDFWLLKYFFNKRQKQILQYSFYHDKEEIIKQLLKYI